MSKRAKQMKLKPIPKFASDEEAGAFWMTHDTTDYIDWSKGRKVSFPNLKPSTQTISLRLPLGMLDELRALANERDVPYQSLMKVYLADRIAEERGQYPVTAVGSPAKAPAKKAPHKKAPHKKVAK